MQIVIDISQEDFNSICYFEGLYFIGHDKLDECITKAFQSAMILPEGHGDLVDRDALLTDDNISDLNDGYGSAGYFRYVSVNTIKESPTVIPADKEIEK